MFVLVRENDYARHGILLDKMYRPRRDVFVQRLGYADGFGASPTRCSLFGVTQDAVDTLHRKTGLSRLYARMPRPRLVGTPPMSETDPFHQKPRTRSNA